MPDDPFRRFERLQRELGHIAYELTRVQFTFQAGPAAWRPAVNAYRCTNRFVVCVDLAGVPREAIEVTAEPRRLRVWGVRRALEAQCDQPQPAQMLAMEIDYGPFERVLELPLEIDPDQVTAEHRDGLLWIQLPLRPPA